WTSTIYTFYTGDIRIKYRNSKLHHVFVCTVRGCGHHLPRDQTTKDHNSTKNLKKHANKCWGSDNHAVCSLVLVIFDPHLFTVLDLCAGSARASFVIAADRGLCYLMKSGRPTMWIPSPSTIARNVKLLFKRTREQIWQQLDERDGCVGLATNAWMSPNHRVFVAVTGHWEENGEKVDCLLDFVEVPEVCLSHLFLSSCSSLSVSHRGTSRKGAG
ncbi:hypothetical protein DFH08DRAFT_681986, partial [Mycena albidolilacea]